MYFSDSVTLRKVTVTSDSYGDDAGTNTDTVVFADKQSVGRSEFYTSKMAGIRIDTVFVIHAEDWGNQTRLIYGTTTYDIIRSYQKGEGVVELSCSVREVG